MDSEFIANLAAQLRQVALHQSAHDFKGDVPTSEVVERAQAYYEFLKGSLPV